jgi:hypothetical protein
MHIQRLILTILGFSLAACSGSEDCEPEDENFTIEEDLTTEEWAQISDFWGGLKSDDNYCRWACETAYRRTTGWEVDLIETCSLEVTMVEEDTGSSDTGGLDEKVPLGATVSCQGSGDEYVCEDDS